MTIPDTAPLFAWAYLEDSPSLQSVDRLLESIPDGPLLAALKEHRGRGRNDYPVESLWGVLVLTIMLRHSSVHACCEELRRNAGLRLRIGIEHEDDVPKPHNMSRFTKVLGQPRFVGMMQGMFMDMMRTLGACVPDLGTHLAGDSTALKARRSRGKTPESLPAPTGGRKEYCNDDGTVNRVVEWFGYKLHLLVDSKHETVLGYEVTDAGTDDALTAPPLLDRVQQILPRGRVQTVSYDKAADTGGFHTAMAERDVRPVVQMRQLWKADPYRDLPGAGDRPVDIVHTEDGTVFCCEKTEAGRPVYRPMAYNGCEKQRGTLKYRCPAMARDTACPMERICNKGKTHGLTVRVKCDIDLRRFPPLPRATRTFERLYKGRTGVERTNARLKVFWGVDDGNIGGAHRFHAQVGVVMLVHAAFARTLAELPRHKGIIGSTRISPIRQALEQDRRNRRHTST